MVSATNVPIQIHSPNFFVNPTGELLKSLTESQVKLVAEKMGRLFFHAMEPYVGTDLTALYSDSNGQFIEKNALIELMLLSCQIFKRDLDEDRSCGHLSALANAMPWNYSCEEIVDESGALKRAVKAQLPTNYEMRLSVVAKQGQLLFKVTQIQGDETTENSFNLKELEN